MKDIFHPKFLAAVGVSLLVIGAHTRGFAAAPLITTLMTSIPVPTVISLAAPKAIIVRRDPFVGGMNEAAATEPKPTLAGLVDAQDSQHGDAAGTKQPIGAAQESIHLRAVVLGSHRYALVVDGSSTRIVSEGDALAGSRVREVSLSGIVLANGARFVPEESAK